MVSFIGTYNSFWAIKLFFVFLFWTSEVARYFIVLKYFKNQKVLIVQ